ncbi:hypothetical protein E8E11_003729 [Didymella keratinophila]|nr:hypothetical protein E8E11_003729 [Didymella keratinophila]
MVHHESILLLSPLSKFQHRMAKSEPSPEPTSESDSGSESKIEEVEPKSKPELKKPGPLRDAKGKFIRRKRK